MQTFLCQEHFKILKVLPFHFLNVYKCLLFDHFNPNKPLYFSTLRLWLGGRGGSQPKSRKIPAVYTLFLRLDDKSRM